MEQPKQTSINMPKLFKMPPAGFDPITASEKELLIYGVATRPDPIHQPKQYKLWENVYSKKPKFVIPEFKSLAVKHFKTATPDTSVNPYFDQSFAGVDSPATASTDPITYILGTWNIPTIELPQSYEPSTLYNVRIFMRMHVPGLLYTDFGVLITIEAKTPGKPPIQEAYIYTSINGGKTNNTITGKWPLNPGDSVSGLICVTSKSEASFILTNHTTNLVTPISIPVQFGTNVPVAATWGVDGGYDNDTPAKFTTINFTNAYATTQSQAQLDASNGQAYNFGDTINGPVIATAAISGSEIIIKYTE